MKFEENSSLELKINYEEQKASTDILKFSILEKKLHEKIGLKKITTDVLKTLSLYTSKGEFNIAAELLADTNSIVFSGVDIGRFGKDVNTILYRETISKTSLIDIFDKTLALFEQYYLYEIIEGFERVQQELIPKKAFREALANAIVHRVWDVNAYIKIGMYDDKIEIISPGGLPQGLSEEAYLHGSISILRNPIIASIFYRLGIIEQFGTGIARINCSYAKSFAKPTFKISSSFITISLPVINSTNNNLSPDEQKVFSHILALSETDRTTLEEKTGFNKAKTLRLLNGLIAKNRITKIGSGLSTRYRLL